MKAFVLLMVFAVNSWATNQVTDIAFLPAANQVIGYTAYKISNSEYTFKNGATKFSLASNSTKLNQKLGIGISDSIAVLLDLTYVNQGSSDLKVGAVTTTSDYKKKLQSPELSIRKRFHFAESRVPYLDILGGFSPKGSMDDIQTSNYVNVGANVGMNISEDLNFEFGSTYFSINSTDTIDARTSYALGVTLQKDLSNKLFIRGAIGYFIIGDEKYSNSTDKISYDPSTDMQLSLGFNKEGTSIDWLVSYQSSFGSNSAKYKLSNVDYSGDSTSSLVTLGAGYSF